MIPLTKSDKHTSHAIDARAAHFDRGVRSFFLMRLAATTAGAASLARCTMHPTPPTNSVCGRDYRPQDRRTALDASVRRPRSPSIPG
jgi:hypothetical protein